MTTVLAEQSMAASFLRWLNVSEPVLGGPFTDRERQLLLTAFMAGAYVCEGMNIATLKRMQSGALPMARAAAEVKARYREVRDFMKQVGKED